ncbi:MAG: DKNYY domain-containing protein [bacterium]|nr:DKNYY domain-containing protein [bacterium]
MNTKKEVVTSTILIAIIFVAVILCSSVYFLKYKNSARTINEGSKLNLRPLGGPDYYGRPTSAYEIDDTHVYYNKNLISADPDTIEILKGSLKSMKGDISYLYARDATAVYYAGKPLSGVISATFQPIENGSGIHNYGTDGKTVYFGYESIPGADPKTFKILWQTIYEGCGETYYSKDSAHVYLNTTIVPNANPETFESLINGFGKDMRGYYKGATYIRPTIDLKELVCNYG